jgi:phenylpropionate dioxygenase-like ring-hydroxylating dioxygenase large terminal subunit
MDQPVRDHPHGVWPAGLTRVPYWVYQDPDVAKAEQTNVFEGQTWNYLCLEIDVPNIGDYRTTFMGGMPVVVARAEDGAVVAFENRCVHRGALICLDDCGSVKDFHCVYHAWRYDLRGNLKSVAFRHGVNGKGGMDDSFRLEDHRPRAIRISVLHGLVFGTLAADVPDIEDYIGAELTARLRRVMCRKVEIIGRYTQALPNNWKLYMENVRDTYHASLLHLFFTTFRITRLSSRGGVMVGANGVAHASATMGKPPEADTAYQGMRSENDGFRLADPSLLDSQDEFRDGIQLQILSVFPGFVLQQIHNAIAVRQVVPTGVDTMDLHWTYLGYADDTPELRAMRVKQANLVGPAGFVSMEDGAVGGFVQRGIGTAEEVLSVIEMGGATADTADTRATEASVRGFWKAWRGVMGL